jgi:hypothetical protein
MTVVLVISAIQPVKEPLFINRTPTLEWSVDPRRDIWLKEKECN